MVKCRCAFCDTVIDCNKLNRGEHEALARAHIAACPGHPIRAVEDEVKRLRAALRKIAGNCPRCEGRGEVSVGDPELGGVPCGRCSDARAALAEKE